MSWCLRVFIVWNIAARDVICIENTGKNPATGCFCKLQGDVDDCSCPIISVDAFNNLHVYPTIQSLVRTDYFRYFKVNLKKECPFWPDDGRCALKDCAVDRCEQHELPAGLKEGASRSAGSPNNESHNKYSKESQEAPGSCADDRERLGTLNTTISAERKEEFKSWLAHDEAQDAFCQLDDENSEDSVHVDLQLNPERYTGYKGSSPHRIWRTIYDENCFKPTQTMPSYSAHSTGGRPLEGLCLEKRAFYRLISGLHTSINIHLSRQYLHPASDGFGKGSWGKNAAEFQRRFDSHSTGGQGPQYLKNLYFAYLVELRAIAKAAPYLEMEAFFTGDEVADRDVKTAVHSLLNTARSFPDHFDESKLFRGNGKQAQQLKEEFRSHFLNISRIMDCVGCEKCKLWGKLQIQGMGTALKILFSGDSMGLSSTVTANQKLSFRLTRTEIVSLVNAFGRLSTSIKEIDHFRKSLR